MQDPVAELRHAVRSIVEPRSSVILANIDRYFAKDAVLFNPLVNSAKETGREGVKAVYSTLKGILPFVRLYTHLATPVLGLAKLSSFPTSKHPLDSRMACLMERRNF
jgi:hypothetical protein